MKKIISIALFALVIMNIHCGGSSTSSSKNTSLVTITVGSSGQTAALRIEPETFLVKLKAFFKNHAQNPAYASIPSGIHKIMFTIAGPDMSTMTKEVFVVGQTQIRESFSVPNGKNRYFLVEAKDIAGRILYRGDTASDLEGKPVFLAINMKALDSTPPSVISTDPASNKTGVAITSAILITFSETIDPATLNAATFSLSGNGLAVGGTILVNGAVATFVPLGNLAYSTGYTATITTGVMDTAGNHMASAYSWSFTTSAAPDTTPPAVTGVSPGIDATSVPVTSVITATFSEAMDTSTVNTSTFTLKDPDEIMVTGGVTYSGLTATFTPSADLGQNKTYTAMVTTGVKDLAGNALSADYHWSFTTAVPDTTPPVFGGLVSAGAASSSSINLTWNAASDDISPASKIAYQIYMATTSGGQNFESPAATVTGVTSTTITGLSPNTAYYFVARAKDEAGNTESNTVQKSATTLPPPPDTTPPTFGGIVSATAISSTQIQLTWNAATDNVTPQSQIKYLIYMANFSGAYIDFYPYATVTGLTSYTVPDLTPATIYYFRIWAVDAAGNLATNTVEKSATTFGGGIDLEPKNAMIGPPSLYNISADIYNNGSTAASGVVVYIESCDIALNCECHSQTLTTIPASSFIAVSVDPSNVPPAEYRIIVDPDNIITGEIQEGNNCIDSGGAMLLCGGTWPTTCGL